MPAARRILRRPPLDMFFLVLVLVLAGLAHPGPAGAENRALIVGVGKYTVPGADLPGIPKDVRMMRDVATWLGYAPEQIMVLQDEKATLAGLEHAIRTWLVDGVRPEDQVLFYFSGHGSQIRDDGKDEPDGVDEVLVPHDVRFGPGTLLNAYRDDDFGALLTAIPARRIYVFLDACHSGTATRGLSPGIVPKFLRYPGMPMARPGMATRGMGPMEDMSKDAMAVSNYVALSAAQDNQEAQASDMGSFFTLGLHGAVRRAATKGEPLDMRGLLAATTRFIDENLDNPSIKFRPVLSGAGKLMAANVFVNGSAPEARPAEPQAPAAPPAPAATAQAEPPASPPVPEPPAASAPAPAAPVASAPAEPAPAPAPALEQGWIDRLKELARAADYRVRLAPNKHRFRLGDELGITCRIERDGYLNVVSIGPGESAPTVLYPNAFHTDNRVRAGETVTIPASGDGFVLAASPPTGQTMVMAFHTSAPANFHADGYGGDLFRVLSVTSTRGFQVQARPPAPAATPSASPPPAPPAPARPAYGAGWFSTNIVP